jgi:hypothetical protein
VERLPSRTTLALAKLATHTIAVFTNIGQKLVPKPSPVQHPSLNRNSTNSTKACLIGGKLLIFTLLGNIANTFQTSSGTSTTPIFAEW